MQIKHDDAMRDYEREYFKAKLPLYELIWKYNRKTTCLVLIFLLLLLNIGAWLFLRYAAESHWKNLIETDIHSHQDVYEQMLDSYLAEENYANFYALYSSRSLYTGDTFEPYETDYQLASCYHTVSLQTDTYLSSSSEESVEAIASALFEFFALKNNPDSKGHESVAKGIEEQLRLLVCSQFPVTKEVWDTLPDLSAKNILACLTGGAAS